MMIIHRSSRYNPTPKIILDYMLVYPKFIWKVRVHVTLRVLKF